MFFHRFEVESVEDVAGSVIDGGLGSGSGRRGHRSRSRRGLSPDRKESEGDRGLVHATEGSLVQIRRMPGGGTEEPTAASVMRRKSKAACEVGEERTPERGEGGTW